MKEYYEKQLEKVKKRAAELNSDKTFSFVFITDLHLGQLDGNLHVFDECESAIRLAEEAGADCIVLGGDLIQGNRSRETGLAQLEGFTEIFSRVSLPVFAAHGNHDDNSYHLTNGKLVSEMILPELIISKETYAALVTRPLAGSRAVYDSQNPQSTYYYADFEEKKVRLVVIDAFDYPLRTKGKYAEFVSRIWAKVSDRQLCWLAQEALDPAREGWTTLLVSHAALDDRVPKIPPMNNYREVLALLSAFNNRGCYRNERLGIAADYRDCRSALPVVFSGHTHRDSYDHFREEKLLLIGTAQAGSLGVNDVSGGSGEYAASPAREKGTETEPLFDLFVVEPGRCVNRVRFGAGESQAIPLEG